MITTGQIILASLSGILGSIIGLIISGSAQEELEANKKTLIYLKSSIIVAMTFLLIFTWHIIIGIIGSISILVLIFLFEKKETMKKIILYLPIFYAVIGLIIQVIYFEALIGLTGLFFIIHTGIVAEEHKKIMKKGIWKKETWKILVKENLPAIILPILFIIISLF